MSKLFIGIDPGATGGIAFIDGSKSFAHKMPDTERDIYEVICDLKLAEAYEHAGAMAVIEHVHSMPAQGVASSFKFGQNYGMLRMGLIAAGIPFEAVTPGVWQRSMSMIFARHLTATQKKNRHKAKAQELFPHLKVTHATADALLIAEYCKRRFG